MHSVILLHDNARPHFPVHAKETFQEMKFEVFYYPSDSPDLAPSDFHLPAFFKQETKQATF